MHVAHALTALVERVQACPDSSTQLLLRLYHHKSPRLTDQPEKLFLFQQEIYDSLRRLHPSVVNSVSPSQENHLVTSQQPQVACRSAQATIRKLH